MSRRGYIALAWILAANMMFAASPYIAYDIIQAKEICDELPLDNLEGIWLYPDDNITVLIIADETADNNAFPSYTISVVDTSDARLHPGDIIGKMVGTPDNNTFRIELSTESKNHLLLKPRSVLASLSGDKDALIIKKQKLPFKGRLNFNFNRLLPGFWKIVSTGISQNSQQIAPPVGMIKIYPSYDGNGSSRRKIIYL